MHVTKKHLADLKLCYAIGSFEDAQGGSFLIGTEKEGPCLRFDLEGKLLEEVWPGPGGVMTIQQVPGREDQFLSTQEFYSPNCGAEQARISSSTREGEQWVVRTLAELPYVHRFGILRAEDGRDWLLACSIKSSCAYREDWRDPGAVYVAPLPERCEEHDQEHQLPLDCLRDQQLRNHGFYLAPDRSYCLIATHEGVFRYSPPATDCQDWRIEKLLEKSVSDICLVDFDGDGQQELLCLSPFHGAELSVFKADSAGRYQEVYRCSEELPFLHALWSFRHGDRELAVLGHRKGERDLFLLRHDSERGYYREILDHDVGPTNVWHYQRGGRDYIVSTNREIDELALYILDWEE